MSDSSMLAVAARLAAELRFGAVVNLGRGLPTLVASALPPDADIIFQSENGIVGVGPAAESADADPSITDASKRPVTLKPGAALFDLGAAFDMIRGGRIDLAVLGAFEVSTGGDLANYAGTDASLPPAVGGAMDLAAGAREVWVLMRHQDRDGRPKIVDRCSLPLTAVGVVRRVFTEFMTLDIPASGQPSLMWQDPLLSSSELRALLPPSLKMSLER
ncbi:MAG TPA: CoA-transferase [Allosphingosinicella sp.]|nr:CoA-transferase [Allosphingosinicella sp.]